jgi:hypothetical protein
LIALIATVVLASACSMGYKHADSNAALGTRANGSSSDPSGESSTQGASSSAGATGLGGVSSATGTAGSVGGGALAAARAGSAGTPGATSPGTTGGPPLTIGYYATQALNGAQFGVAAQVTGDPIAMGNAIANWVNTHGGVAGRQIKLVTATSPLIATSTPQDQNDQAACAKFTEDNHVFAVVGITGTTPVIWQCLARAHVLFINANETGPDQAFFMTNPDSLFAEGPTQDRGGATAADGLWRANYFADPGAKIGVVTADHAWFKSAEVAFQREAAAHGVTIAASATICHTPCTTAQASNDAQNDVVKFRAAGINHVVVLSAEGGTFLQQAGAAAYYPRIGYDSFALPFIWPIAGYGKSLNGAIGAGWGPGYDVQRAQNPPLNPKTQQCETIMHNAGISTDGILVEIQAWYTCGNFFMLKAALDGAGRADYSAMRGAIEGLGSSLIPTTGFTAWYGPTRHDGLQSYRLTRYSGGCNCMEYADRTEYPIPPLPGQPR